MWSIMTQLKVLLYQPIGLVTATSGAIAPLPLSAGSMPQGGAVTVLTFAM